MTTKVAVVGGGLVGLCCAYYLRRGGADVVILERERVGSGASRGNAGEICPSAVEPLPAPGMIRHSAASALRPGGALSIRPTSLGVIRFALRFARWSNARHFERGLAAMAALGRRTYDLYDELAADGIGTHARREGYLYCCSSEASARAQRRAVMRMVGLGLASEPGPVLDAAGLAELEPEIGRAARAGFLLPDERFIDPSSFVDDLEAGVRRLGVEIIEDAEVSGLEASRDGVQVAGTHGRTEANAVVIAGGARSRELLGALGIRVLLQPGKGYSFSVHPAPARMPARCLYVPDAHVAVTPMGGRLRIAGTMQLDGSYDRFDRRRIPMIARAIGPYLQGVDWEARTEEWSGPRPMTPDGLPMIGPVPGRRGVFIAAGHNMLGLTLAPTTGKAIADTVLGADPKIDLAPFAPMRPAMRA